MTVTLEQLTNIASMVFDDNETTVSENTTQEETVSDTRYQEIADEVSTQLSIVDKGLRVMRNNHTLLHSSEVISDYLRRFGVDRNVLSLFNSDGFLDKIANRKFGACENYDNIGSVTSIETKLCLEGLSNLKDTIVKYVRMIVDALVKLYQKTKTFLKTTFFNLEKMYNNVTVLFQNTSYAEDCITPGEFDHYIYDFNKIIDIVVDTLDDTMNVKIKGLDQVIAAGLHNHKGDITFFTDLDRDIGDALLNVIPAHSVPSNNVKIKQNAFKSIPEFVTNIQETINALKDRGIRKDGGMTISIRDLTKDITRYTNPDDVGNTFLSKCGTVVGYHKSIMDRYDTNTKEIQQLKEEFKHVSEMKDDVTLEHRIMKEIISYKDLNVKLDVAVYQALYTALAAFRAYIGITRKRGL